MTSPSSAVPARITHVAIRIEGETLSLPGPNRHHHIISEYHYRTGQTFPDHNEQGFLDSEGRFLNRKQALGVALVAGQVKDPSAVRMNMLFSEDVW